jgi:putative DNA primase/helicase
MSASEAFMFLQSLRPGGPWVLTAITPDGTTETITAHDAARVDAFVSANIGRRNIYYSLNPTRTPMSSKATKKDIAAVEYLHADLDPNDSESTDAAKARYLERIAACERHATALVDSGNGIQGLWKLETQVVLDSPERIADVEARTKALTLRLGGKAGTQNVDRILRLPGTVNMPNEKKRSAGRVECPARLIEFNGATHPLDAFPRAPEGGKAKSKQTGGGDRKLPQDLINMLHLSGDSPAGYQSRSELFYAFLCEALRRGIDENEIIDACVDPALEGHSIHDHVAENGGRDYVKRQIERAINATVGVAADERNKQKVYVRDGGLFDAWRQTQVGLVRNKCPVFIRHNRPVEPLWRWERDDEGRDTLVAQLVPYNFWRLSDMVARHAVIFFKLDGRTKNKGWRRIDPPKEVIETLLTRGDWEFPSIIGIVTSPTLRPDLSVLDAPGYDAATGLWFKSSDDVTLPAIPERPTREEALAALALLKEPIENFPFDGNASQSAALAAILTTALRGILRVVPIFAVVAPDPRTGKTFLVELICVIATGHRPVSTAGSNDLTELEKRIETAALSGRAVIHLNNLPNGMTVESERLSELCTEGLVYIRKLGRHEEGLCDCRGTTMFLNGNNIVVAADLVPRTAICRLDARMEEPGARTFAFDPIELVRRDRAKYLAAIFTVVRAFKAAGSPEPKKMTRVAGFEDWSRTVQQPLMWLGEADPLGEMKSARALDPSIEELRRLLDALKKYFAPKEFFTAADCARLAEESQTDSIGRREFKRPDLREEMSSHGKIDALSFGVKLRRHRDRILDGWSLRIASGKRKAKNPNSYYLEGPKRRPVEPKPSAEDPDAM